MDWNKLWGEKMSKVTYAGVIVISCRKCGYSDRNCCDCAKALWIERRSEKLALNPNYLCKQDSRYWYKINNRE